MIIIDKQLEQLAKSGTPIKVGLIGAGFAARGLANHLIRGVTGMQLVGIANRTLSNAVSIYEECGTVKPVHAVSSEVVTESARNVVPIVTTDFELLTSSPCVDVIVEATGEVEFGARVSLSAIRNKKHLIL